MHKVKYFDTNYLLTAELSDDDLFHIFERNSLTYSLIAAELKIANYTKTNNEITKLVKNKNWQYTVFWTEAQHDTFYKIAINVYKTIYQYSYERAKTMADWFIIHYGLTNKKLKKSKHIHNFEE